VEIFIWLTTTDASSSLVDALMYIIVFASVAGGLWITMFLDSVGMRALFKSETVHLFGVYLQAKKQKVCPIYKVI
jgi:hypothetical protein